jgi:SlyX protein
MAFMEKTLEDLNAVVTRQSRELEELRTAVRHLSGRLRECTVSNVALPSEETPPPHY